jgi:hypothetical protein
MKKDKTADTLSGTLTQVLLSPKGVIEKLLPSIRGKQVQISTAPGAIDEYAHVLVAGVRVVAMGERRMTALGTTLLEAREINHVKIA